MTFPPFEFTIEVNENREFAGVSILSFVREILMPIEFLARVIAIDSYEFVDSDGSRFLPFVRCELSSDLPDNIGDFLILKHDSLIVSDLFDLN